MKNGQLSIALYFISIHPDRDWVFMVIELTF